MHDAHIYIPDIAVNIGPGREPECGRSAVHLFSLLLLHGPLGLARHGQTLSVRYGAIASDAMDRGGVGRARHFRHTRLVQHCPHDLADYG